MNVYQEKVLIEYGHLLEQWRESRRNGERKAFFVHVPGIFGVESLPIRSAFCTNRSRFDLEAETFPKLVHVVIHTSVTSSTCPHCGTQMTDI